jgi:hypothetical protein
MTAPLTVLVAIHFADDSLGLMQFVVDDGRNVRQAPTDEAITAEIARSAFDPEKSPVRGWTRVQPHEVPADRTFRNAWTWRGAIVHDMAKARAIHRQRLRELRAPRLAALDAAYAQADEQGDVDAKQRIGRQRQALRDVTADPEIEVAATPEALRAVMPEALRG